MDHDEAFAALVEGFATVLGDDAVGLYVLAPESAFLGVTRSRVERAGEDSLRGLHRTIASETLCWPHPMTTPLIVGGSSATKP